MPYCAGGATGIVKKEEIAEKSVKMLHIRHGSYEERGLSTAELVEKEYGKEALSFCKEAFVL